MRDHPRILVVRPDRVGDVILATPLIRALRQTFPDAHLTALVRPYTSPLLENSPHLDDVLLDDPGGRDAGGRGFWRQVASLRRHRFDTALLLLPNKRHAWMLFLAGIRTRIGVGRKLYQVMTFMRSVSRNRYVPLRHEADYCLDLGRAIGVDANDLSTEIFLTPEERDRAWRTLVGAARERLEPKRLIGIHPGSGGSAPNWSVGRYVDLARRLLREESVHLVLTGGAEERGLASAFQALDERRVTNLMGQLQLRETASVIAHLAVLVSPSTGPMHMAAALRVPTVSLFCKLTACSPHLWGPQGNQAWIVEPESECQYEPGVAHECVERGVEVDRVARIVREALTTARAGGRSRHPRVATPRVT
ncbi:MAG: glycosyltransferase family 9 protein [Candidatus Latescibacterota bacterium]|nr:MAG: glycosyltransferase family 9 protein [Candidatus Latescibacterota bacterium]